MAWGMGGGVTGPCKSWALSSPLGFESLGSAPAIRLSAIIDHRAAASTTPRTVRWVSRGPWQLFLHLAKVDPLERMHRPL